MRDYLWCAVDHEGEVLEVLATKRRDRRAALKFLKRAMKRYRRPHSVGEPEPKAQSNFTDPESQIMKTSSEGHGGRVPGRGVGVVGASVSCG